MSRRRKVRDVYGNWTWDGEGDEVKKSENSSQDSIEETGQHKLDWRDYVALSIASLETFLLPLVIFIVILVVLAILFTHF